MTTPYVKFFRGTPMAFEKLTNKNDDTLYFISVAGEKTGKLYLGDKLISDNINTVAELEDILLSDLLDGQLLSYDSSQEKWINKSVLEAIGLFDPATETEQGSNGLVPAPGAGMQNAFLRGDGQWVKIEESTVSNLTADEKSVSVNEEIITLKDFGIKYYKYVPAENDIEAHYEAQIVNDANPWKEGLEPKVVEEDGELILGWFEPNPTVLEEVAEQVTTIQEQVKTIAEAISTKANAADVFTKEETAEQINRAITAADHMVRKIFKTLDEAETFAILQGEEAAKYIFMVKNANALDEKNKYEEYLYVNGTFELIGNWEVELDNYVTKDELNLKVDKVESKDLVLITEIEKLATVAENAEPNFIKAVETSQLKVEDGLLSIISVGLNQVTNLEELLNTKADKNTVEEIGEKVDSLEALLGTVSTKVDNLAAEMGTYVTKETFTNEISEIKKAITWQLI